MSSSASSETSDVNWLDIESDEEQLTFVSLFGSKTFSNLKSMLAHCKNEHGFDLEATIDQLDLEFHDAVKLVNYVRRQNLDQKSLPKAIQLADFASDDFLRPEIENDALLFSLDEILHSDKSDNDIGDDLSDKPDGALVKERNMLLAQIASVQDQFKSYRLAVEQTLDERWGTNEDIEIPGRTVGSSNGDSYFESYAANEIHETMLKDQVRTDAYRDFIYGNKDLFQNKVVLDIGCGTGILSMFCAKAGASQVFAVDKSDIIDKARENVFNNGLSETINCLRGAIEDVQLPVDQVDIIVSEWMGYCLLYEAMLPSVLYARDKYLKPDGLLVPSSATIWIAPIETPDYVADNISYWDDVYGFNMSAMQERIYDEVRIETMSQHALCATPFPFKILDLRSIDSKELIFSATWKSTLTRPVGSIDGFLIWFDNFFSPSSTVALPEPHTTPEEWNGKGGGNVAFTTGPFGKETHWKQGLLLQPSVTHIESVFPDTLSGEITFSVLPENARALRLEVSWAIAEEPKQSRVWDLK